MKILRESGPKGNRMATLISRVLFVVLVLLCAGAACYRARTGVWPVTLMALLLSGCAHQPSCNMADMTAPELERALVVGCGR